MAGAEGMFFSAKTYSRPSVSSRRTRPSAATPHLRAKPWALGGVTVSIEGDVGRGTALDLMDLIGRSGDVGHERSQSTRARDHADLAMGQTGLVETLGDHGAKLLDGIVQRCGGHFLRTNLKQEILSVCHGLRHLAFLVGILVDSGDLGI